MSGGEKRGISGFDVATYFFRFHLEFDESRMTISLDSVYQRCYLDNRNLFRARA